jgi:hypothetical protein
MNPAELIEKDFADVKVPIWLENINVWAYWFLSVKKQEIKNNIMSNFFEDFLMIKIFH